MFLRRGDANCRAMPQSTSLPRPISDRRASLDCRAGLGSIHGDPHFRYLGAVKGFCVASESYCAATFSKSVKMPFMLRAATFRLMFQRALELSIVIFRCRSTRQTGSQGGLCTVVDYWASSGRVTISYSSDVPPMWFEASTSAWITRL